MVLERDLEISKHRGKRKEGNVKIEPEIEVQLPKKQEMPRIDSNHQKLEEVRKDSFLELYLVDRLILGF